MNGILCMLFHGVHKCAHKGHKPDSTGEMDPISETQPHTLEIKNILLNIHERILTSDFALIYPLQVASMEYHLFKCISHIYCKRRLHLDEL